MFWSFQKDFFTWLCMSLTIVYRDNIWLEFNWYHQFPLTQIVAITVSLSFKNYFSDFCTLTQIAILKELGIDGLNYHGIPEGQYNL